MAQRDHEIQICITNPKAVKAFGKACELICEALEDAPRRDDLKEAVRLLRVAAKGLIIKDGKE